MRAPRRCSRGRGAALPARLVSRLLAGAVAFVSGSGGVLPARPGSGKVVVPTSIRGHSPGACDGPGAGRLPGLAGGPGGRAGGWRGRPACWARPTPSGGRAARIDTRPMRRPTRGPRRGASGLGRAGIRRRVGGRRGHATRAGHRVRATGGRRHGIASGLSYAPSTRTARAAGVHGSVNMHRLARPKESGPALAAGGPNCAGGPRLDLQYYPATWITASFPARFGGREHRRLPPTSDVVRSHCLKANARHDLQRLVHRYRRQNAR